MMNCNQHDYVEIACMYRFLVKLTLRSELEMVGIAIDTGRNECGEECLKIEADSVEELVQLDVIEKMEALVENPHFKMVFFD